MRYQKVLPISRQKAQTAFLSGIPTKICDALVRVTYHDSDWRWIQEQCLIYAQHQDATVRALAATCLGHLARIHKHLDLDKVMPRLKVLSRDRQTAGQARDALDDIDIFLKMKK